MITCVKDTFPPEYLGLSTDNKTTIDDPVNASQYVEFDTGKIYFYNQDTGLWQQFVLA